MTYRAACAAVLFIAALVPPAFAEPPATVFLEELTWTELRGLVQALAERIARALGNALVAPVIAYVPEGGLRPVTGHMRFPGTITVPDDVFQRVLESAARSVRLHGFRDIVFLGDHGSTQAGENAVAARLNREWTTTPVRAHAIEEYYRAATAGFRDVLKARGYRPEELGDHAALPDTSLTLALDPGLVRMSALLAEPAPGAVSGVEGDPRRASAELGQPSLERTHASDDSAVGSARNPRHDPHPHLRRRERARGGRHRDGARHAARHGPDQSLQ